MIGAENLTFSYSKQQTLLNQINVDFEIGYIHALVGSNGEGKSTLFKLLAGLIPTYKLDGHVKSNQQPVDTRQEVFLKEIYFLSEDTNDTHLTLEQYRQAYGEFYPNFSAEIFDNLCNEFNINPKRPLHKQSLGQKKKAMLAFAFATQVSYLLLDEPANGLDIESKAVLRNALFNYSNGDRLVIVSTHNIREIDTVIDYLTVLKYGKIVLSENTIDLNESFEIQHTREPNSATDVIYEEKIAGGFQSLTERNIDSLRTEKTLDLEVIYKAACANPAAFSHA